MAAGYEQWSHEQLVARIEELERRINGSTEVPTQPSEGHAVDDSSPRPFTKPPKAPPKAFDASKYSTRLVALKFAYLGQKYNGFEHHNNNKTPLPTIEEELWKALIKTRLINPTPAPGSTTDYSRVDRKTFAQWDRDGADVNWEGCEYSKCGRTDRGVSAFGQVIGIRVRSNRKQDQDSNDLTDELPYIQLLNRVLPPDIRVYAWCPNPPPDFSARFSCKERRYKYFFTNPCFASVPGSSGLYDASGTPMREGWLDIAAMRDGCSRLIGLHDFRNYCKIDASKQLTNFQRRIFHASIDEVSPLSVPSFLAHGALASPANPEPPKMYAFTLHGSAFLWHQVRSLISILFLVGQRLESPQLVSDLLDMSANPTRPKYEMASDAPLVLWDCIFPAKEDVVHAESEDKREGYEDSLRWVYVGDDGGVEARASSSKTQKDGVGRGKWGRGGVVDDVWEVWRGHKIDETLSGLLMERIAGLGTSTLDKETGDEESVGIAKGGPRVFDGGNFGRAKGNYIPVLNRERQEPVEVVNERYAKKKGLDPERYGRGGDEDAGE